MIRYVGLIFVFIQTFLWADFPYYVSSEVLSEIKVNEERFERQPTDNEVMFDLAMSYAYSGQILSGWKILKKIPKSYSSIVIETYENKMKIDDLEWRYPFKCAFGYFFIGEKQHAIDLFFRVLELNPKQAWAYGFIALIYGEMDDVDNAVYYCKKGLEIEPNATAIHFLLGEAYRRKKQYFKAFKQFMKVGRLESK